MCRRVGQLKALCAGVAIKFETEGRVKKKTKKWCRTSVTRLLHDRRAQGLEQRHLPGELPVGDREVNAPVPAHDVPAEGVDLKHGQHELRPSERVRGLVRHLHRKIPHELLLRVPGVLARDLRDAVLGAVEVRPVVAVDDGVLDVRVVAPGELRVRGREVREGASVARRF